MVWVFFPSKCAVAISDLFIFRGLETAKGVQLTSKIPRLSLTWHPQLSDFSQYQRLGDQNSMALFSNGYNRCSETSSFPSHETQINNNNKIATSSGNFDWSTTNIADKTSKNFETMGEPNEKPESCKNFNQTSLSKMLNSNNPWSDAWLARERTSCQKEREVQGSTGITEDVQRKLQAQLALKQQEVQELQQKIAKNRKWGDCRKGSTDRYRNVPKPPVTRSIQQPVDNFPQIGADHKKRKGERLIGLESKLDPNSPCFYPSQKPLDNNMIPFKFEVRHGSVVGNLDYGKLSGQLQSSTDEYLPKWNDYNASFPKLAPINTSSLAFRTDTTNRFKTPLEKVPFAEWNNNRFPAPPLRPAVFQEQKRGKLQPHHEINNQSEHRGADRHSESRYGGFSDQHNYPALSDPSLDDASKENSFRMVRKASRRGQQQMQRAENSQSPQNNQPNLNCADCKRHLNWPHIISCFHSLCFSCLAKHFVKFEKKLKCPTCSSETNLNSDNLRDLDLDILKCKTLLKHHINPFSCMSCSDESAAVSFCPECMQFMCLDCKHRHETSSDTSSHELQIVNKVTEVEEQYVETCENHPKNSLEYFCEECKKLVCSECTSVGQNHVKHRVIDKAKLHTLAVKKIRLMSSHLDEMKNDVQKRIQPLTLLKQDLETSIRVCKQDIHKYSNFLLAETEKCRSNARLYVDRVCEDFVKDASIAQNLMVQYLTDFSPLSDFYCRHRFGANPIEFLSALPLLSNKLSTMEMKYDEIQKQKGIFAATVSFEADYSKVNEYLQSQYNRIIITENLSDALPSHSTELGRRIDEEILLEMERKAHATSPPQQPINCVVNDPQVISCEPCDIIDPQDEMFNYNRTPIGFFHQFGKYGRGDYEFVEPSGILYLMDGSLVVCDTANHRIMVYDENFKHLRSIGQPPNLPPLRNERDNDNRNDRHLSRTHHCLYFPYRIAQCPRTENIVIIERPPSRDIQVFSLMGEFITCFGSDILQHPRGVAVDEQGVIVTIEGRTMKLMLFSQEGQLLHRFYLSVHLEFPNDVAVREGLIYISDNRGHCVHVFDYNADHKRAIGNESVTYYPIGVSLTHLNQVVVTDNHNTFNISIFDASNGRYLFGFKSKVRHANCYNVSVHPNRLELAVTSRENQVVIFNFDPFQEKEEIEMKTVAYFNN